MKYPTKANLQLVRYGKFDIVEQKNNFGKDGFHNAPEKFGCYAFIHPYVELFLMGHRSKEPRYTCNLIGGEIWTHLIPKRHLILDESNSWYKINVIELTNLLKKYHYDASFEGEVFSKSHRMFQSNDHFELFITKETLIGRSNKAKQNLILPEIEEISET